RDGHLRLVRALRRPPGGAARDVRPAARRYGGAHRRRGDARPGGAGRDGRDPRQGPDADGGLLQDPPRRHVRRRGLLPDWRPGLPRRRGPSPLRHPRQGRDQDLGRQRGGGRGGGGARPSPDGQVGARGGRAPPDARRERGRLRRAPAGSEADRYGAAGVLPRDARRLQGPGGGVRDRRGRAAAHGVRPGREGGAAPPRAGRPRGAVSTMAEEKTVLFDVTDRVATITLNRPERKNAMNQQLKDELRACWQRVKADPDIWVAILTGAGDAFS